MNRNELDFQFIVSHFSTQAQLAGCMQGNTEMVQKFVSNFPLLYCNDEVLPIFSGKVAGVSLKDT